MICQFKINRPPNSLAKFIETAPFSRALILSCNNHPNKIRQTLYVVVCLFELVLQVSCQYRKSVMTSKGCDSYKTGATPGILIAYQYPDYNNDRKYSPDRPTSLRARLKDDLDIPHNSEPNPNHRLNLFPLPPFSFISGLPRIRSRSRHPAKKHPWP